MEFFLISLRFIAGVWSASWVHGFLVLPLRLFFVLWLFWVRGTRRDSEMRGKRDVWKGVLSRSMASRSRDLGRRLARSILFELQVCLGWDVDVDGGI